MYFKLLKINAENEYEALKKGMIESCNEKYKQEEIDWQKLWEYEEPYQLSKYPGILREFKVSSVLDVAIVLALIRPGSLHNYDKMKMYIHTDKLLKNKTDDVKGINMLFLAFRITKKSAFMS